MYNALVARLFAADSSPAEKDAICVLLDEMPSMDLFDTVWVDDMPQLVA